MSAVLGRNSLLGRAVAGVTKAYEAAEAIKSCPECGYDAMDGAIQVPIEGENYYVQCPLMSAQCRYGQELEARVDRRALNYVRTLPELPIRFHAGLEEPESTEGVRGVNIWSGHLSERCFLALYGGHGTGKSFAAAYALYVLDRKKLGKHWDRPYLQSDIRALWTSAYRLTTNDEIFEAARNVPVLVIDDLGGEVLTPTARGKVAETIAKRYDSVGITIITTNDGVQDLAKTYGNRMYDRLMSAGQAVYCGGESRRLG